MPRAPIAARRVTACAQVFGGSKISDYVQFPLDGLNMSEFVSDTGANAADSSYMYAGNLHSLPCCNDFHSYDAIGTIEHRGMLYGGHYISYTKHPVDGLW